MPGPELPPDLVAAFLGAAEAEVEGEAAARRERWKSDPVAFRMDNRKVGPDRVPYRDVFAPWQEEHLFRPMDRMQWLWNESPRGHDRTDAEGWIICDRLQNGPPFQRGIVLAADRDQARFPLERAERYAAEERHLFPGITVQKNEILGPHGSKCVVLAADLASSLGELPDWVFLEEVGVWPDKGAKLKDSIIGSCMKRGAPVCVFTNALFQRAGNWRWDFSDWWEGMAAKDPERFHFWRAPGWVAEWSRADMEALRGALSPTEAARFLDNRRLEQGVAPPFAAEDVARVFAGGAFPEPEGIVATVQATDYGLTGDAFCVGTVALDRNGVAWVVEAWAAAGAPGKPVRIEDGEAEMLRVAGARTLEATRFDEYQAASTIQKYGPRLRAEVYDFRSMSNRRAGCKVLRERVKAGTLRARPGAFARVHADEKRYELERELIEAVSVLTAAGEVIDHPPGGHNDALVVLEMALSKLAEVSLAPTAAVTLGDAPVFPWARRRRTFTR